MTPERGLHIRIDSELRQAARIKALEENQQVMIPGLREQAKGQKVYVEHEYAKLKGVILGNPESMYLPDPFHPSWYTSFRSLPRDKLDWMVGAYYLDAEYKDKGQGFGCANPDWLLFGSVPGCAFFGWAPIRGFFDLDQNPVRSITNTALFGTVTYYANCIKN